MKKIIDNIKENYKLTLSVLVIGIALGWVFFHSAGDRAGAADKTEAVSSEEQADVTWTCSMHPQIKQPEPGDCPICGMDLIPLSRMDAGSDIDPNEIMLSEAAASLADIQTTVVTKGSPEKTIYLQGKVEADERNIVELTARYGGRIEKLFISFTGENVTKGEPLATIYSPELVTAQRELIEAMSLKETRPSIYNAARAKLKLWDLTDQQIESIEEKGEPTLYFDVLSPISGTVMDRHVAVGDYVKVGDPLFMVVDLTSIWVMFDAYEADLPWISVGDEIGFTIHSIPGKTYSGKVAFIDPFINPKTRVAKVRVELPNPGLKLKPEMFASGILSSRIAAESDKLLIPKSSILWTGKRSVVYVKVPGRESPSFLYREIELGPEAGNFYVVGQGLEEGEEIATHGVFKIDAAAQLEGKPSMMNPQGAKTSTGHDHGHTDAAGSSSHSMEMEDMDAPEEFSEQLTVVYHEYLDMTGAFVESDAAKVKNQAAKVEQALQNVDMGLLEGNAHMVWMDQLVVLEKTIEEIRNSEDIDEQRKSYASFNLAFYKSVKAFGLSGDTVYYQYCPMALEDKGAYWFSEIKEIRNPYFGDMMLKCGETRETIK